MIQEKPGKVGFGRAIAHFFKGYVDFKGRSTRAGYWWIVLFKAIVAMGFGFLLIVSAVLSLVGRPLPVAGTGGNLSSYGLGFAIVVVLYVLWVLATLLPSWALQARRLRDVGMTGKGILLNLVTYFVVELIYLGLRLAGNVGAGGAAVVALSNIFALFAFFFAVELFIFDLLATDHLLSENKSFWFRKAATAPSEPPVAPDKSSDSTLSQSSDGWQVSKNGAVSHDSEK